MTFEKGSIIMTNATRVGLNEGGRGLKFGLVVEDKCASEKLKIQSDSLTPQSDSEYDSQSTSLSYSDNGVTDYE